MRLEREEQISYNRNVIILIPQLFQISIIFYKFIYLFIYWLCWVFIAACGVCLVAASGGYSSLWCAAFSLWWLLLLLAEHGL